MKNVIISTIMSFLLLTPVVFAYDYTQCRICDITILDDRAGLGNIPLALFCGVSNILSCTPPIFAFLLLSMAIIGWYSLKKRS